MPLSHIKETLIAIEREKIQKDKIKNIIFHAQGIYYLFSEMIFNTFAHEMILGFKSSNIYSIF